jgi:hypothetical protein
MISPVPYFAAAVLLCLGSAPGYAADAAAAAEANPTASNGMISLAQADAVIVQNGFTPLGQPKQKGSVIGSLARLGSKVFIITVDAQTGQFLDAKPTTIALPPAAAPVPAGAPTTNTATVATPAAVAQPSAPVSSAAASPVKRAADLARSKGFRVLSFRHRSDDTFLIAKRGTGLFSLKIDDRGHILAVVPVRGRVDSDDD